MNNLFRFLLLFTFSITLNNCQSDDESSNGGNGGGTINEYLSQENALISKVFLNKSVTQSTNLKVYVLDENNLPASDVFVSAGGKTPTPKTNALGYVLIENVLLNKEHAMVKFSKTGYVSLTKTIIPSTSGITFLVVKMVKLSASVIYDAKTSTTVIPTPGVEITFEANSLLNPNTRVIQTGNVNVSAYYNDPSANDFGPTSQGSFASVTLDEKFGSMKNSFGMVKILLTDNSGNILNLKKDAKATLKLPAPDGSPAEITLWHFNEIYGIWVEAGIATKVGDKYVAEVKYFSTYNLSEKLTDFANLNLTISDGSETLTNQKVELYLNDKLLTTSFTDKVGKLSFLKLPTGVTYKIKVPFGCTTAFEKTLDPVSAGDNNQTVSLSGHPNIETFEIYGKLTTCTKVNYTNKAFTIKVKLGSEDKFFTILTDSNGEYSVSTSVCSSLIVPDDFYTISGEIMDGATYRPWAETITKADANGNVLLDINACDGIDKGFKADNENIEFIDNDFKNNLLSNFPGKTEITFGMAKELTQVEIDGVNSSTSNINDISEIVYFINLTKLVVKNTRLTTIPNLANLSKLKDLTISRNNFNTTISLSIVGELTSLEKLDMSSNKMFGDTDALTNLVNLKQLNLRNNFLKTLTTDIGDLSLLENLDLSSNQIDGDIPTSIGNLSNLKTLVLSNNKFTSIPSSIGNLTNLNQLIINNNDLSGSIPATIGNLGSLTFVDLSINYLTSSIPASIGNLINLTSLNLGSNQLSGSIPNLGSLGNLTSLNLSSNQLSGPIPAVLGNMMNLKSLNLSSNFFSDEIPVFNQGGSDFIYLFAFNPGLIGSANDSKLCLGKIKELAHVLIDQTGIAKDCP